MKRMVRCAAEVTKTLDYRIDNEDLDGETEAMELREALERVQAISLEISEELDAGQ